MKSLSVFFFVKYILLLLPIVAGAQKIDYPAHFTKLLNEASIEFFEPLDAGYREVAALRNDYVPCDLAIRSPQEDLQIQYVIHREDEKDTDAVTPNVRTFITLTNLAANEEEALISAIQPDKETLQKDFNADWGMLYFFTPKPSFSAKPNCRMLALHKEGRATVFIFYLFDDPDNTALDTRYLALRFL